MKRLIIDVREPHEYEMGHVRGAINLPPSQLMAGAEKIKDIPRDTELVLYCISGARSNASIPYLQQLGFANIVNGINKHHVEKKYL